MNLRDIKKDIDYVIGAFVDDCYTFATIHPASADLELSQIVDEALDLYDELRDRSAAKAEGSRKAQFAAIRKDLLEKTDALYAKLSDIVRESCKAE